jgi:hypothetical protein
MTKPVRLASGIAVSGLVLFCSVGVFAAFTYDRHLFLLTPLRFYSLAIVCIGFIAFAFIGAYLLLSEALKSK